MAPFFVFSVPSGMGLAFSIPVIGECQDIKHKCAQRNFSPALEKMSWVTSITAKWSKK